MRARTVVVSAVLHGLLAAVALRAASTQRLRAPTEITIVGAAPKEAARADEPPPKDEPPPPPRDPPAIAPRRAAAPVPEPAPADPAAPPAPRHLQTGIILGNAEGPGVPVVGEPGPRTSGAPTAPTAPSAPPKPGPVEEKRLSAPVTTAAGAECAEPPTKPVPVSRPTSIEYTSQARADGAEGRLVLAISVASDGSVADVQVKSGVHPSIDAAAASAVRSWRFTPAMRCGKPVEGNYTLARRFELGD